MKDEGSAQDRLLDLMIKRALEGVDLDEARELTLLARANPDVSAQEIEYVIALLDATPLGEAHPLPDSVASYVAQRLVPPTAALQPPATPSAPGKLPWFAVAAALLLAIGGWWNALTSDSVPARTATSSQPAMPATAEKIPGERERERVDGDATALSIAWSPPADSDSPEVRGAVHWSGAHQLGYMELDGLVANDPTVEQYQLWIFDASRSADFPVNGGIFDVSGNGMQNVLIRATIEVRDATLFAITVEKPGGVMVSGRERIVALAQAPTN